MVGGFVGYQKIAAGTYIGKYNPDFSILSSIYWIDLDISFICNSIEYNRLAMSLSFDGVITYDSQFAYGFDNGEPTYDGIFTPWLANGKYRIITIKYDYYATEEQYNAFFGCYESETLDAMLPAATISYDNNIIANIYKGQIATLACCEKKAKSNIVIDFITFNGIITYNNKQTEIESSKTAELVCMEKCMKSDVVVDMTSNILITFSIDGIEYQAEEGMTWKQWLDSEYSTPYYSICNGAICKNENHYAAVMYNNITVYKNDIIAANYQYLTGRSAWL